MFQVPFYSYSDSNLSPVKVFAVALELIEDPCKDIQGGSLM